MVRALLLALCCAFFIAPAEARQRRASECNVTMPCDFSYSAPAAQKRVRVAHHSAPAAQKHARRVAQRTEHRSPADVGSTPASSTQIVEHPSGCPQTAFCGCGAAVRIFGKPVRYLWLAANWFHFPRAAPAPGMVAVRQHHVFVLEARLDRGLWLVYDANSGRHLTRVHARSIAGYTIVNPHSG
jgi:hypothetical protein